MGDNPRNTLTIAYMDNENFENADSSNGEGEELELEVDLEGDSDEVKALKENNKKLFERAKKAEGFVKQPDGSWVKKAKPTDKPINNKEKAGADPSQIEDQVWTIAEMIREGYTREDANFIMKNGGREALKDPNSYVARALAATMEQRKAEAEASKVSSGSGTSEAERKFTQEQLKNMSSADLAKILPHAN